MQVKNRTYSGGFALIFLLLLAVSFIPYILLSFYSHPVADDYTYGADFPFWNTQLQLFQHWNGRYTANFLIMSNPIISNWIIGYRLASVILIILIPLSILFLVQSLIGKAFSFQQKSIAAIIITFLILGLLPSLAEGIYWYPGAMTYILGCIFALCYVGLIIRYYDKSFFLNRSFHIVLCILFLGLSIGFNEVQMLIFVIAHFVMWLTIGKENRFNSFTFILFIGCIVFSSVMFFAPGNYFRGEYFPHNHNLINSFLMTALQTVRFFFAWISFAPLWIASILYCTIITKLNTHVPLLNKLGQIKPWIAFSALWVILFLCIFPPYWSTGILGQHRTLNTACFYFIPFWFLFVHTVVSKNNLADKIQTALTPIVQVGLGILLVLSLLFSGNSGTALMELATGKISGFNREMNNRYTQIAFAKEKGIKKVTFAPLQNKPASHFVLDIQPGCNHWINQQQAHFYGLEKIYGDTTVSVNSLR